MKKIKIVLWGILIAFILLVYFQNRAFFDMKQALMLDLYVIDAYQSSALYIVLWFLIAMVIGFLIAYFIGLIEKFKMNKTIKGLKAKTKTQTELIAQLRHELESRSGFPKEDTTRAEAVDVNNPTATEKHEISPDV